MHFTWGLVLCAFTATAHEVHRLPSRQAASLCSTGQSVVFTVQQTDTLGRISRQLSSGICDIVKANKLPNADVIQVNQTLIVPVKLTNPDNTSCIKPPATAVCVVGGPATVTVKAGDAFVTIAAALGITADSLIAANPGVDRFNLAVGQILNVPVCKQ